MYKLILGLCFVLLSACANQAHKEVAIPTKLEDFKRDRYNRLTCGGYAVLDYALALGGSTTFIKANTSEFVCEAGNSAISCPDKKDECRCPPPNWISNGCVKYHNIYNKLILERNMQRKGAKRSPEATLPSS